MAERPRVLVTGASGFVGSALAARLVADGVQVFGLSRHAAPTRSADAVRWLSGDIRDAGRMVEVTRDIDAVFHVGGLIGHYGLRDEYMSVNVGGAHNIIAACRANGVRTLVFTSTPSVIADGTSHFGVDETHPYARRFESPYSESKALAEQAVRAANSRELRTVCLRPHMIWGPGPNHWVGGLRKLAARGLLLQVGAGRNRVGITYLDDCVEAHVAAWKAGEADAAVGGQVFFVHGGEPVLMWSWVRDLAAALGLGPVRGRIPRLPARAIAKTCDALVHLSRGALHFPISGYVITELTTDHYSRIDRAREWLGFRPSVGVAEGIARMALAERREAQSVAARSTRLSASPS